GAYDDNREVHAQQPWSERCQTVSLAARPLWTRRQTRGDRCRGRLHRVAAAGLPWRSRDARPGRIGGAGLDPPAGRGLAADRPALAVAVVAVGQLVLTAALGALSIPTVVAEATTYVVLGLVVRLYAGTLSEMLRRQISIKRAAITARTGVEMLTRREREVAQLAAQGYTAREIGEQLHIG